MNSKEQTVDETEDPLSNYEPIEYGSKLEAALAELPVAMIESRPYAEVNPATPIRQAVHALHGLKVASLLVVDDGRLVGIFTERDVLERVAEQYPKLADLPVSQVMTSDPLVVYASAPAGSALAAIAAAGYRHVPVLDGRAGRLVGIISPRRAFAFLEDKFEIISV